MNTGYVYPLLKTHKIEKEELPNCELKDIPIRLVQAVGNTFLSKTTALLEELMKPISVAYCKDIVNEYCKDSLSYIQKLNIWKNNASEDKLYYKLIAADVKSLYPSLSRELIEKALKEAVSLFSNWSKTGQSTFVNLCMNCLKNQILEFQGSFYTQKHGIVTGENNSVSLANVALHYIIRKITEINTYTFVFPRFIDNIMLIT